MRQSIQHNKKISLVWYASGQAHIFLKCEIKQKNNVSNGLKIDFFKIFSKSEHFNFKAYVASQLQYKCGQCGNFGGKEKFLRYSGAEIEL